MSSENAESDVQPNDEQQILALHEAGDKALMSADLDVLARIFADDYVQYNEAGTAFTKQDVLNNFRTGAIRYPSIVSTGRRIRVFGDTAVVHGSESDEVEAGGERLAVRYVTSTSCGNATESGSWWRRSWRGRWKNDLRLADFPCVPLCPLWFTKRKIFTTESTEVHSGKRTPNYSL